MNSAKYPDHGGSPPLPPLALSHSWPLWERSRQFELGHVLSSVVTDLIPPARTGELGVYHAGCWECDLADNSLVWSGGVYDLFGLVRGAVVSRKDAISFYSADSLARMEKLRSYAIRHRRGFTLDVDIHAATGETRWMRIVAEPLCDGGRPVRLQGLKLAI